VVLEDRVILAWLIESELILEARAAPAANADTQARGRHVGALSGEELAHLVGTLVGDRDHTFQSIASRQKRFVV
jgi:hypothetical protein